MVLALLEARRQRHGAELQAVLSTKWPVASQSRLAISFLAPASTLPSGNCTVDRRLIHFVPRETGGGMTPVAGQFGEARIKCLPMAARRTHAVGQREQPAHPLDVARLAAHDAPALRRMVADLEQAAGHRHDVTVHV